MDMDKLTIMCNGNVEEAFNETNGKFFDYLWGNEFECTWSCMEKVDQGVNKVMIFGYEPVDGMVQKFLDTRRRDNATKTLKDLGINVISIKHSVVNTNEFEEKRRMVEASV